MAKNAWTDYDPTAVNNADAGGVNIAEGCDFGNMNNMGRELMSHTAEVMNGTSPMSDGLKIGYSSDLTANFTFDCSGITTSTTRTITMPDGDVTLKAGAQLGASDFSADGEILVGTGSGAFQAESGSTLRTSIGVSEASTYGEATAANYRAAAADKLLVSDTVWGAMAEVALSSSSNSVAWDMSSGIDFDIDTLGENTTLANPSNVTVGKKGRIRVVQDGTGGRTMAFGSNFVFLGGTAPTLSTAASAEDYLYYDAISATKILISALLDVQ